MKLWAGGRGGVGKHDVDAARFGGLDGIEQTSGGGIACGLPK